MTNATSATEIDLFTREDAEIYAAFVAGQASFFVANAHPVTDEATGEVEWVVRLTTRVNNYSRSLRHLGDVLDFLEVWNPGWGADDD